MKRESIPDQIARLRRDVCALRRRLDELIRTNPHNEPCGNCRKPVAACTCDPITAPVPTRK